MNIFERHEHEKEIPEGYQAVTIHLDARASSSLLWDEALQSAEYFIQKGLKLVFDVNLGLFQNLQHPLSHQAQFSALKLSMDHFYNKVLERFEAHVQGVIIVKDLLPVQHDAKESSEYLTLLVDHLPSTLDIFALYDARNIKSFLTFAQYTRKDLHERIILALRSPLFPLYGAVWEEGPHADIYIGRNFSKKETLSPHYGVILPEEMDREAECQIDEKLTQLLQSKIPFKIIPEALLATEWDELNTLYIPQKKLGDQGMRMLQGFAAAGGNIYFTN